MSTSVAIPANHLGQAVLPRRKSATQNREEFAGRNQQDKRYHPKNMSKIFFRTVQLEALNTSVFRSDDI